MLTEKCALPFMLCCCLLKQVSVDLLEYLVFKRARECGDVCPNSAKGPAGFNPSGGDKVDVRARRSL